MDYKCNKISGEKQIIIGLEESSKRTSMNQNLKDEQHLGSQEEGIVRHVKLNEQRGKG